jgi:hypothetical protein
MAGKENLVSLGDRTTEEQREIARQGGIKSGEVRRARKTLKETLLLMLEEGNTQNDITLALLQKALNGDTKAYEVIRDTVGEKPTDKIEQSGELNNTITVKFSGDVEEWGK